MKKLTMSILCMALVTISFAQNSVKSELFNRKWTSPYISTIHSGRPLESAFPTGFSMSLEKDKIYRDWYFIMPGSVSDTFSKAIDTFDLTKKVVAYSRGGRRIESTTTLSNDQKSVSFVRNYFSASNPSIIEFTYNETFKLTEDGSVILEKEGSSDDPNSNFIFVGEKRYPKDPDEHKKKSQQMKHK